QPPAAGGGADRPGGAGGAGQLAALLLAVPAADLLQSVSHPTGWERPAPSLPFRARSPRAGAKRQVYQPPALRTTPRTRAPPPLSVWHDSSPAAAGGVVRAPDRGARGGAFPGGVMVIHAP